MASGKTQYHGMTVLRSDFSNKNVGALTYNGDYSNIQGVLMIERQNDGTDCYGTHFIPLGTTMRVGFNGSTTRQVSVTASKITISSSNQPGYPNQGCIPQFVATIT